MGKFPNKKSVSFAKNIKKKLSLMEELIYKSLELVERDISDLMSHLLQ